jgi:hypothetical protein
MSAHDYADGEHPKADRTSVSELKKVPPVVNQRRPIRTPPKMGHKTKPPETEGTPDAA